MTELNYGLLFGVLVTTLPTIIYSIWKETRFVKRGTAALYAFASIGFGILYYYDSGFSEITSWALGIFSALGIIFLIVVWRNPDIWNDKRSLPFSHKMIGGFQIAFLYQLYLVPTLRNLPTIFLPTSLAQNVVLWGAIFTGALYLTTLIAKLYKNS